MHQESSRVQIGSGSESDRVSGLELNLKEWTYSCRQGDKLQTDAYWVHPAQVDWIPLRWQSVNSCTSAGIALVLIYKTTTGHKCS